MGPLEFALHLAAALVLPPLLPGVAAKVKAAFAGRCGPPVLQPWRDIVKLLRKGSVFSSTSTWVFKAGPVVALVTALLAVLLVPLGSPAAPVAFAGDALLLGYALGLGRFFTVAAALDTGSAFEGMGSAREAAFSCLAEPALFFALLALARLSGSLSLEGMLGGGVGGMWEASGAAMALVVLSLAIVLLAENCRVPFDDPNTHLELTMIHEAMVLDHGGPALGLISYAAAVKLFVFAAIVVRLALPVGTGSAWVDWPVFLAGVFVLSALVGVVESVIGRLRLPLVPNLLVAACLLAAFGVLLLAR